MKTLFTDEDTLAWKERIKEFGWNESQRFGLKFLSGDLWILTNVDNGALSHLLIDCSFDEKILLYSALRY